MQLTGFDPFCHLGMQAAVGLQHHVTIAQLRGDVAQNNGIYDIDVILDRKVRPERRSKSRRLAMPNTKHLLDQLIEESAR
jgi:hypothetical protein